MMRAIVVAGLLLGAIVSAGAQTTLRVGDQKGNSLAVMEAAGVLTGSSGRSFRPQHHC
jgi:sulfonate transport system substrate-binding protein